VQLEIHQRHRCDVLAGVASFRRSSDVAVE